MLKGGAGSDGFKRFARFSPKGWRQGALSLPATAVSQGLTAPAMAAETLRVHAPLRRLAEAGTHPLHKNCRIFGMAASARSGDPVP